MKKLPRAQLASAILLALSLTPLCQGETLIDCDFSRGDFAHFGWTSGGGWDVFRYGDEVPKNPGPLARFPANLPDGQLLSKSFAEIARPKKLKLSLDYGWGWGDAAQAADGLGWMLLDAKGNGYVFEVHRTNADWAVQWGKVDDGVPVKDKTWAPQAIDATRPAVRDGGGLARATITREADGSWTFASPDWNKGAGGAVRFTDNTTASFARLVLIGTKNFDDQLFNRIVLEVPAPEATQAIPANEFLDSIGVVTTFPDRGQPVDKTVEMLKYTGIRWVRGGIEGLSQDGPTTLETYLELHRQTGVRFSWGLVSGGTDIARLLDTARPLGQAGALLAFEGNNEPNNWGITYQGEAGGGRAPSWLAVAKLQRDLYQAVKNDPQLKQYPVWSISEAGAETDNVGLQFLTIPAGAEALLPPGTRFADSANVHNYLYHPGSPGPADNKSWNAADPSSACKVDGLYGNHGVTWAKHFRGYSEDQLNELPRVTTETGCTIDGPVTEQVQALNLLSMYLDQFKRGWSHTAVYLLRDRTDEAGNQTFGLFKPDYQPRKAALYLHRLTAILADERRPTPPDTLNYSLDPQPATLHDLLLKKSDGTLALIVWSERLSGSDEVTVNLGGTWPRVSVFDPTQSDQPTQQLEKVDSLRLLLSDHPLVIVLSGKR